MTTMTWELPFGKGRKYMNRDRMAECDFGGWELMGSQHFQSGPPMTVTFAGRPNLYLPGASRPNQMKPNDEVKLAHVDIGAEPVPIFGAEPLHQGQRIRLPGGFHAGTLGRNTLQASGLVWVQTSLAKEWPIVGERVSFNCAST